MGPLRESSKEQKTQLEKETARSRIPRLVLRPQQKVSPASESPFSEEESREFNPPSSSGGSRRTISSNSFCSDDTGCPSSQSVSPVKTPSDAGNSPISFCTGSDGDFSRKKFSPGTISEGNPQLARYKKEAKASLVKPERKVSLRHSVARRKFVFGDHTWIFKKLSGCSKHTDVNAKMEDSKKKAAICKTGTVK